MVNCIAIGFDDSVEEALSALGDIQGIDSAQLEYCQTKYQSLVNYIPLSVLYVEPTPWPVDGATTGGVLQEEWQRNWVDINQEGIAPGINLRLLIDAYDS